jgi:DNA polymerase III alpha subunit
MWINIKTEYTFKAVYGHLNKIAEKCATLGDYAGIADIGNTFGHVRWKYECKKVGIKPIYGVVLPVFDSIEIKERRIAHNYMTFIAKTTCGLQEIYELVNTAYNQFYYKERISYDQVNQLSNEILVLSGVAPNYALINPQTMYGLDWKIIDLNMLLEIGPHIPLLERGEDKYYIATIDNFYPNYNDNIVYESFAESRLKEQKTYSLHIPTEKEWLMDFPQYEHAIKNLKRIGKYCNVELPKAKMIHYTEGKDINTLCTLGAKKRGLNIWDNGKYRDRYKREMKLILEKKYADYFLVVADLIRYAKTKMTVGPARGSAAGSLVCYLLGITEIDPLKYDLYFERFIDVNRFDLPDIDIDFQDEKRHLCLKYLEKKYGKENVAQIGSINRMKPKSAITRFADALNILIDDVAKFKDSIDDFSTIKHAIENTEIGKDFIKKYPSMASVSKIEGHASHTGVHAAGILVCNEKITKYCGINSRNKQRIAMIDMKDAEKINLLKIDALGLRTVSIFADVCHRIEKPYKWLYEIDINDQAAFKIFNDYRYNGIFQFEGHAVMNLAKKIKIESIEDIAAISALGRPGPLASGASEKYIKYRVNKEKIEYINDNPIIIDILKTTYGVIIYQEQVMRIVKEIGKLSWEDTSTIRKAISKSKGGKYLDTFYEKFEKGAVENKLSKEESKETWESVNTMGSYGFNKSHAISYAMISYICAYLKAHYPQEFCVACLNNTKNDRSAIKILRDAVENDNIKYKHFDRKISVQDWSIKDGILYGGLKTIAGIGQIMANKIVKLREEEKQYPTGIAKKLNIGDSPFKYLYPGDQLYGEYYDNPVSVNLNRKATHIKNIVQNGNYVLIGCLIKKNIKDLNDAQNLTKRDGKYKQGETTWLNIILEDDTAEIMCQIKKENYNKLGKDIFENGKEEKDWYVVFGSKINDWNLIFVNNIKKITKEIKNEI